MNYNCPYAERRHGTILLFCKKRNNDCMNQRFCRQRGETVLTQYAKDCPARKNPDEPKPKMLPIANEQEEAPVEAEKPKKKSTAKKKKTSEK
ncbi:MAG: hypothetical protein IKV00_08295 [Clostridia bacterium]|nr:hypothetical protein [Clostridia bacterium]